MASFLHQLKILLWKNWLNVRRQPVWSCVLIIWPIVIFIILAITRSKFPPVLVDNCYLAPRNLISTGLIPFLQTFLCTTDSACKNTSSLPQTPSPRSSLLPNNRMEDLLWNTLHRNQPNTQADENEDDGYDPSPTNPGEDAYVKLLPGPSLSRAKRDTGNTETSRLTVNTGQTSTQDWYSGILKILLCNITEKFVPATSNHSAIQAVSNILSNYCSGGKSLMGAALQEVGNTLLTFLDDPENQIVLLADCFKGLGIVKQVQKNTALWDFLLSLSEGFKVQVNFNREAKSNSVLQDVQDAMLCVQYFKNLGQAGNSSQPTQTANSSNNQYLGGCVSLYQKFTCDPAIDNCWPEMKPYFETAYWLITTVSNSTGAGGCTFKVSSMSVVCDGSASWEHFYQTAVTVIQETMKNHTTVKRLLNESWVIFQQNGLQEIISLALNLTDNNQTTWSQELQPNVKSLLRLLINATQEMISVASQSNLLNSSSIPVEILQNFLQTMQQKMLQDNSQTNANNVTDILKIILQGIVQNTQLWANVSLSTYLHQNETKQAITQLETLIDSWLTFNSGAGYVSFNYSSILIKIFHILNQPDFLQLTRSLQYMLMPNSTSTQTVHALLDSLKLFTQILNMNNTIDASVFKETYLKQVFNFLVADNHLQGVLSLLVPYVNMSRQLHFLQSAEFRAIAVEVLYFLSPSNLHNVNISGGNISSALLSLFSKFIPKEEQEIFHNAVNVTMQFLDSIQTCKDGPSNCIQSLLKSMDNTSLLIMVAASNITEFLQTAQMVLNISDCNSKAQVDLFECILSQTQNLAELLQTLQLAPPILSRLSIVSSIVQYWKREMKGNTSVDQQLNYLYDLTTVVFQNEPVLASINSSISNIFHALNSVPLNNVSHTLTQTINLLLHSVTLNDSVVLNFNVSSISFFQINVALKTVKTELQIAEWYINYMQNQTKNPNIDSIFYPMYKITQLIVDNAMLNNMNFISSINQLSSLLDLVNISRFTFQENAQQLQLFLKAMQPTLKVLLSGYPNSSLPWHLLNTKDVQNFIQLVSQLLQEDSGKNLVVEFIENIIQLLKNVKNQLSSLGSDSNANFIGFDNKTAQSMYALFADGASILIEIERGVPSRETIYKIYHLANLLAMKDWNTIILLNASSLETQLLNLLFSAINPFLVEDTTSEGSYRICTVKDALHIISQVMYQNVTLSDSLAHMDCKMPFTVMMFENGTTLNQTLGETLHLIMQIIGLSNEFGSQYQNEQASVVGENMACIIKSLRLSTSALLNMSDMFQFKSPWLHGMYETLTSVYKVMPEDNTTCGSPDSKIQDLLESICQKQLDPFHIMVAFIWNQTYLFASSASSNGTDWSTISTIITNIFNSLDGLHNWNDTMYELLLESLQTSNSYQWPLFPTVWKNIDNFRSQNWTSTRIDELLNYLIDIKNVLNLAGNELGPEIMQACNLLISILQDMDALGFLNVTNLINVNFNTAAFPQCKNISQLIASAYHVLWDVFNQTDPWAYEGILSNMTTWMCSLLNHNDSFPSWEEKLQTFKTFLSYVKTLAPTTISKYFSATMNFFSTLRDIVLNDQGFTYDQALQTLDELLPPILEIFNQTKSPVDWMSNSSLRSILSLLLQVVQNSTAGNEPGITVAEKVTAQVTILLQELLKKTNATSNKDVITSASDMMQAFLHIIQRMQGQNSTTEQFLKQSWNVFHQSGIEGFLNEKLRLMLASQYPDNQQLANMGSNLLQLLFNITNEFLSNVSVHSPYINSSTSMEGLRGLLDALQQIALDDTNLRNWGNLTHVLVEKLLALIQDVQMWKDLTISDLIPQNDTDLTGKELKTLIADWTSMRNRSIDMSAMIIKVFYILNQPKFFHLVETFQGMFTSNQSFTQVISNLLEALQILNNIIRMNSTLDFHVPAEVYLKQVLNYLTSDIDIQRVLSVLAPYINVSGQHPIAYSDETRNIVVAVLSLLSPLNQHNISSFPADLISLFSPFVPKDQQVLFESKANHTLRVLESMRMCQSEPSNCTRRFDEFIQLLVEIVQFLSMMENNTLGEYFDNSSLLHFGVHNDVEISLINSVFSLIWSSNGSETGVTVFEKVLSTRDFILNITIAGELNITLAQSIFGSLEPNVSEFRDMLEAFASSSVSKLLLQIERTLLVSGCNNQTTSSNLMCTLDITLNIIGLLQQQNMPRPLQENFSLIASIIKFWMVEMKVDAKLDVKHNYFYNLTMTAFQNLPVLNAIHSAISEIVESLNDIKIIANVSTFNTESTIMSLLELMQPKDTWILSYNMSDTSSLPIEVQLRSIERQLEIVKWYIVNLKNQTQDSAGSESKYPWYSLAQLILNNALPNIQSNASLQSILSYTSSLANSLNHSHGIPEILSLLKRAFQDGIQELQQFINYTQMVIQMLFPNHTDTSARWNTTVNQDIQNVSESTLNLLQVYNGIDTAGTNIPLVLERMQRVLEMLKSIEAIAKNIYLPGFDEVTSQKVYEILKEGIRLINVIESGRASSKEVIYAVYNFSLVLENYIDITFSQNPPALETKLLDTLMSILTFFPAGSHKNESEAKICSIENALQLALNVIFRNATLNESLAQTGCQLTSIFQNVNNGTSTELALEEFVQAMMDIVKITAEVAEAYNKTFYNVGEETACFLRSLEISAYVLSKVNSITGIKIQEIQSTYTTLSTINKLFSENNITCAQTDTHIVNILANTLQNQSNTLELAISLILRQIDLHAHGTLPNISLSDLMMVFSLIPNSESWKGVITQLLQGAFSSPNQLDLDLISRAQQILQHFLKGNLNMTEVGEFVQLLEELKSAFNLSNGSLEAEVVQAQQFLNDILVGLNSTGLLNLSSWTQNLNPTAASHCESVVKILDIAFENILTHFNLTESNWARHDFISNTSMLVCELLLSNNPGFNWAEELKKAEALLLYLTPLAPVGTAQYVQAAGKLLPMFSDLLQNGISSTSNYSIRSILGIFTTFLALSDDTKVVADVMAAPSLQDLLSLLLNMATTGANSSPVLAAEEVAISAVNAVKDILISLNFSSHAETFSNLSETLQMLINITQLAVAKGSTDGRVLKDIWTILQNSGFETFLREQINQLIAAQYLNDPQLPSIVTSLWQLLAKMADQFISSASATPPYLENSTSVEIILNLLDNIQQNLLQETWPANGKNLTLALVHVLQAVLKKAPLWQHFSINNLFPQNETNQSMQKLEMFIQDLIFMDAGTRDFPFNYTTAIIKIFFTLGQPEFLQLTQIVYNIFNSDQKSTRFVSAVMNSLQLLSQIIGINNTNTIWNPAEIYLGQLINYLAPDTHLQRILFILRPYFNISSQPLFEDLDGFRDMAMGVLQFLDPLNLQNVSSAGSGIPTDLLTMFSKYIPTDEQDIFNSITNATLRLLKSMQACNNDNTNCTSAIDEFQQLLGAIVQFVAAMQNHSLGENFDISLFNHFKSQSDVHISIINNVFAMLLYSTGNLSHSQATIEVYERVLLIKDLILNVTGGGDINATIIGSLAAVNFSELESILQVFMSSNITDILLQIEGVLNVAACDNQTESSPLLCTLDISFQLFSFLQKQWLPQALHNRVAAVTSIIAFWMNEPHGVTIEDHQILYFYELTKLAIHNDPALHLISNTVSDALHTVEQIKMKTNASSSEAVVLQLLLEIMQPNQSVGWNYDAGDFSLPLIDQLNKVRVQVQIAQWFVDYVKNITEGSSTGAAKYPMYKITQLILSEAIGNMKGDSTFLLFVNYTHHLLGLFNQSWSPTDVLNMLKVVLQDGKQLFQRFINHTQPALQGLFTNQTNTLLSGSVLLNEELQNIVQMSLYIAQEYSGGQNKENMSMVLDSIDQLLQFLLYFQDRFTVVNLENLHLLAGFKNETVHRVYNILQEGVSILHAIDGDGITQEILHKVYNFTYLLFPNKWNENSSQNASALGTQILNLIVSAISPFPEESNGNQGNPKPCSAKDSLNIINQIIFFNLTLNESLAQANCQMPFMRELFENITFLNQTLGDILHLTVQILGVSNEFATQFGSAQAEIVGELMAYTVKSLQLSTGLLSQLNYLFRFQIPQVQSLYETITSIFKILPKTNKTCNIPDAHILALVEGILNDTSNPIHIIVSFIVNQTEHYAQGTNRNISAWEEVYTFMTIFNSLHTYPQWNKTTNQLLQLALNISSISSVFDQSSTLWQVTDKLININWNAIDFKESIKILQTMKMVLILANSSLGNEMMAVYQILVSIIQEANASGLFSLTKQSNFSLSPLVMADCQNLFKIAAQSSSSAWKSLKPSEAWIGDNLVSSLALLTCNLLNANQSDFSWESEFKIIDQIIYSMTPLAPNGTAQYFNATGEILSALMGLLVIGTNATANNNLHSASQLVIPFIKIMEEKRTEGSWSLPPVLNDTYSFFLNLVKTFATTSQDLNPSTPNIILDAAQVLKALSKTLEASSYSQALSATSEMLKLFSDSTVDTSTLKTLTEQLLTLENSFNNLILNKSMVSPYSSLLRCLENVTAVQANQSQGHLEGAVQLIQAVFAQNYTFEDSSLIPGILKLKITQIRNLTSLFCGPGSFGSAKETCLLPCQYFLQVLNSVDVGINAITGTKASSRALTAANTTNANMPSTGNSFVDTLLQNTANQLHSIDWIPSNLFPVDIFQNMTRYLSLFDINISLSDLTPQVKVSNLFKNVTKIKQELNRVAGLTSKSIDAMMDVEITNTTFQMLSWFLQLSECKKDPSLVSKPLQVFCNMPALQGYKMALVLLQNVDAFSFLYRMYVPETLQNGLDMAVNGLSVMADALANLTSRLIPLNELNAMIDQAQSTLAAVGVSKSQILRSKRATRVAVPFSVDILTRVLCTKNITFLLAYINQLPQTLTRADIPLDQAAQNLIAINGIPTDATPFCKKIFLNVVNTTNGAFSWVLLKPILYGQIVYTPETPETRAIMQKINATLAEIDRLRTSAERIVGFVNTASSFKGIISQALPVLITVQNYLRNPFVQVLISSIADRNATAISAQIQQLRDYASLLTNNQALLDRLLPLLTLFTNVASCFSYDRILPTSNPITMDSVVTGLRQNNTLFAGIIFDVPPQSRRHKRGTTYRSGLPAQVTYTIRMNIRLSQPTTSIRDVPWIPGPHESGFKYLLYGKAFVFLQDYIERSIIELQTNKDLSNIAVQFQPMPYACYTKDNFLYSVTFALPIVLMVAWVLFVAAFVKRLVLEKDLRLHEYMKMMGVNSCSHFFAWFIECTIFLIITVIILVIILKCGNILPQTNGGLLFLFLIDYSLSVMAMSYLISVFFHDTNIAALCGSLIYIISFFPFIVLASRENSLGFAGKTLLGLFSPTAFSYATQYIAHYESQDTGLQWSNIYISPVANDTCSFGWMCWLLLIDSGIYFIVGWYIRMVFPGKYGMGVAWYFPFQPSFWEECCGISAICSRKRPSGLTFTNFTEQQRRTIGKKGVDAASPDLSPVFEPEPSDLLVGVSLHGLTKTYQSKTAVDNLNLNFYEGQITSLLGHNGAGKTTTISMLTGLFSASSGTINVYGEDIHTHLDHIRKSMGVCMQYDVLFPHLTTKEHLLLYGAIKAPQWSQQQLHAEVKRTLQDTGLYNHRYKVVGTLSGGMKRKLSICIALIGGSRVVILDEPTTGVDPCSRRAIWEIISKHKRDKTIILSTHHLDEAEVLSDRIAFLENGGLKCCGSPFFLKEKFGEGYHLTLTKKFSSEGPDAECKTEEVTALIQSHIPAAVLKEDVGEELVYVLPPFNADISSDYLSLLRSLDAGMNDLRIGCYGISDTTVEEVFLKLTEGLDDDENAWSKTKMVVPITNRDELMVSDDLSTSSYSFRDDQALTRIRKVGGTVLLLKKMMAIFIKRFHNSRRNWKGLISQILLPVLFIIAAMGLGTLSTGSGEYPALTLSPALYGTTNQSVAFGNSNSSTEDLVKSMLSFPGIDNTCRSSSNCLTESQLGDWTSAGNPASTYGSCNCTKTSRLCEMPVNTSPPHRKIYSGQMIYNVTGYDMEQYLITTTNYFEQKRYGSWSFGLPLTSDLLLDNLLNASAVPANRTLSKVWYNSEGYHTLPAYLNSLNNFILRANLPSDQSSQYGISVRSHPYPGSLTSAQSGVSNMVNILVALCILVGYSITTASFVIYVVQEYQNGSKRLQHISGISETCYWVTNFLYDMLLYLVPVSLSIATIAGFKLPSFYDGQNLGAVSLLLVMFGFSTFTWMYTLAGMFKNPGMAFIVYVCINLFIGINTIVSATVVNVLLQKGIELPTVIDPTSLEQVYTTLIHIFKIFPQFCFGYGFIQLSNQQINISSYAAFGIKNQIDVFRMDILGWMFVAMACQGVFFFCLRLLLNYTVYQNIKRFVKEMFGIGTRSMASTTEEDIDVQAERERVESGKAGTDLLQLHGLTKIYHLVHKNVVAVNNMTLGIRAGECFGLLGVNGAGKTTTFKMLTGDIAPSSGNIQIQDPFGRLINVLDCNADWSSFGYCPQDDALDGLLTGEEHLYYYARVHGIPEKRIKVVVNDLLNKLQLMRYKSRITAAYSCGTRRKLSTALALIGGPSILLLDEPSSGMDPKTKRHLWKVISDEVRDKCAVVLTSHSMEECEALCTRLAIMVRGKFQCIGSMQHIKNRFGSGFTVKMHLRDSSVDVDALTQLMCTHFPNTYLKDQHFNMVEYHVPVSAGGVANIFDLLETNKAAFHIRHFSVSQTTLDEVFINFAHAEASPDNSNDNSQEFNQVVVS